MYTREELIALVRSYNPAVLKYYDVLTIEEGANECGVSVEDFIETESGWESYGGKLVGSLFIKKEYYDLAFNQGEDIAFIWENGFCGIPYGSKGREQWATGLEFVDKMEEGYTWNEDEDDDED